MYKRFKGSSRNLLFAAGFIVIIILLLMAQFLLKLNLVLRIVDITAILACLYCTGRFIQCYTYGIRMTHDELRVARFTKSLTIPVQQIEQIQADGLDLHIITTDHSEIRISLKDVNEIDRKVITSLIKYYRS